MGHEELRWESVDWILLIRLGDQLWAFIKTIMNIRVSEKWGDFFFWLVEQVLDSEIGLCFMQLGDKFYVMSPWTDISEI